MTAENEMNVSYILEKYGPHIELETANPLFGGKGLPNMGLNDVSVYDTDIKHGEKKQKIAAEKNTERQ